LDFQRRLRHGKHACRSGMLRGAKAHMPESNLGCSKKPQAFLRTGLLHAMHRAASTCRFYFSRLTLARRLAS
jgi:hypothetical protein